MNRLYVAGQDPESREWIPVAELQEVDGGYQLTYTQGAHRLPGFSGLSRMQALDQAYYSTTLFPFFSNRLVPKSRPEYQQYLRWLGLESMPSTPLEVLSITGGVRATDSYEVIAPPRRTGETLRLDFFLRGLRYQSPEVIAQVLEVEEEFPLFLMKDVQNVRDANALALRAERPHAMLVGYVPRYYCAGLTKMLDRYPTEVVARVKRVNKDAPLDMKLLVSIDTPAPEDFDLLAEQPDFRPISTTQFGDLTSEALSRTDLNI